MLFAILCFRASVQLASAKTQLSLCSSVVPGCATNSNTYGARRCIQAEYKAQALLWHFPLEQPAETLFCQE